MPNAEDKSIDRLRVAMASTNELFNSEVFGKQNFDALDEIYTEEARILPPGADIISGRKAIKEFWSNLIQSVNAKSATLASVDVMLAGDGAVEIGRAYHAARTKRRHADAGKVRRLLEAGEWPLEMAR